MSASAVGGTAVAPVSRVLMVALINHALHVCACTTLAIAPCRSLGPRLAALVFVGFVSLLEIAHVSDRSLTSVGVEDLLIHGTVGTPVALGVPRSTRPKWRSIDSASTASVSV